MASAPVARKRVIEVGAPWYVSGTHRWKGTAAISNPNPVINSITPKVSTGSKTVCPRTRAPRESDIVAR
jgi:hypothetical protein